MALCLSVFFAKKHYVKETTDMAWPRVKEGRGGYHQEDVKHARAWKYKKGRHKKRWLNNIRDDMNEYKMTKYMEQNRSVWHMKTKAGT